MSNPYYAANDGSIPVVQGTVVQGKDIVSHLTSAAAAALAKNDHQESYTVAEAFQHAHSKSNATEMGGGGGGEEVAVSLHWTKGQVQPKRCNDFFFALLFYVHLGVMGWCFATNVPIMTETLVKGYYSNDYGGGRRIQQQDQKNRFIRSVKGEGIGVFDPEVADDEFHAEGGGIWRWKDLATSVRSLLYGEVHGIRVLQEEVEGGDYNNDAGSDEFGYGEDREGNAITANEVVFVVGITGLVGFVVSALTLSFMTRFAKCMIQFALFFNIGISALIGIMGLLSGVPMMAMIGFVTCAFGAYYAYLVWPRIPFAAANLITAVAAVRANFGLSFLAYSSLLFLVGWWLWWSVSFVASMFVYSGCDAQGQCEREGNGILVFLFLVSLFWTLQVIKNTIHTTVAGTVGTWWFAPAEASSCCSSAVCGSFVRSVTFSFGSICFGSLIVAIIQAMKEFLRQVRETDDGVLLCCAECLLGCLESLAEYFNQWAFCYVGLYGYSFMEAGQNVMTLFKSRGWTTIITDDLVDKVLLMVSIGVGLITGLIAVLITNYKGLVFDAIAGGAFMFGLLIGYLISGVLMGVIGSAVNTTIVCYAEAPNEFQANHPKLSNQMRSAWRQAWPVDFTY